MCLDPVQDPGEVLLDVALMRLRGGDVDPERAVVRLDPLQDPANSSLVRDQLLDVAQRQVTSTGAVVEPKTVEFATPHLHDDVEPHDSLLPTSNRATRNDHRTTVGDRLLLGTIHRVENLLGDAVGAVDQVIPHPGHALQSLGLGG